MISKTIHEIINANITHVSLVGKGANGREFLIIKSSDAEPDLLRECPVIKVDDEKRLVTGIVYEPNTIDSQGEFMSATAIEKAAHQFLANYRNVDKNHSFQAENVQVVESYVAKSNHEIDGVVVKKGTWVMTTYIGDDMIWEQIKKGELNAYSMGGTGEKVNRANLTLPVVEKSTDDKEISGFFSAIKEFFTGKSTGKLEFLPVNKSGKKISSANKKRLDDAYQILTELRGEFEEMASDDEIEKEDSSMTEAIIKQMIDDAITKAVAAQSVPADGATENKQFTEESVQKMIDESIKKAFEASTASSANGAEAGADEQAESALTAEAIQKMIRDSVEKAIAPILKARALPSNLNGEPQTVEKSNDVFAGFFTQS